MAGRAGTPEAYASNHPTKNGFQTKLEISPIPPHHTLQEPGIQLTFAPRGPPLGGQTYRRGWAAAWHRADW
jgi:hypothetical protein